MRFQVPQFVDIEDKIIGPLTVKQFLYYVIAVMALVPLFALVDVALFVTIALPVIGAAAAFAHLKVYGQSLAVTVGRAFNFYFGGHFYLWQRGGIRRLIRVSGEDFDIFQVLPEQVSALPALSAMAQTLETAGKLVTEDVDDPITGEEAQIIEEDETVQQPDIGGQTKPAGEGGAESSPAP